MRPQKVLDSDILKGLTAIFRAKGYEGASLKELSEATGLKKASLYHRFPNGKQEMADAVLNHLNTWVNEHIFNALFDENFSPQVRLKNGLSEIRSFYKEGKESCIFRALSMQAGFELFEQQVKKGMKEWVSTFKKLGIALRLSPEVAEKKAVRTLIEIQGSLLVAKALNDISVFEDTIHHIEEGYLDV